LVRGFDLFLLEVNGILKLANEIILLFELAFEVTKFGVIFCNNLGNL